MKQFTLTQKKPVINPNIPIEADVISPDIFAKKSIEEIKKLIIWRGNRQLALEEIFNLTGAEHAGDCPEKIEILLTGELSKYKHIGEKMSAGKITIKGSIGMHLGSLMSGGKIVVEGDTHDFTGANMTGGEIHIQGNAGHYLGGSMRGNWRGMSGGKIKVDGNVLNECGVWMRKGIIEIDGSATMFLGMHMHRGTIIVHGDVIERAGAEMTGGEVIILGKLHRNLPSFEFKEIIDKLLVEGFGTIKGPLLVFAGDFAERKQGKMFLLKKKNEHLID
ncbi:MAG: formylmethanofuran dehydrogenase subunit C [Candidatus Heimdallarchaeota archaeon]